MNTKTKIATIALGASVLFGCRTPVTPEECWADYGRYYNPTGETAVAPEAPAQVRLVKSKEVGATVDSLKTQGYVVLGEFKIEDGTEISRNAVAALAQKLNASEVVWSSVDSLPSSAKALPNPDMGIIGVDKMQMATMNADRSDMSFAEQVYERHYTIWMLGKKAK